jgi:hypothetical protein
MSKKSDVNYQEKANELDGLGLDGLIFIGIIKGRSRKLFEDSGKYRYSYILQQSNGHDTIINVWGEHTLMPVGYRVIINITVRPYVDKHGQIRYNLVMPVEQNGLFAGEEEF